MSKQTGDESAFGVAAGSLNPTATYAATDALALIFIPALLAMTSAAVSISNHQAEISRCKVQAAESRKNAEWERRTAAIYAANVAGQPRDTTT